MTDRETTPEAAAAAGALMRHPDRRVRKVAASALAQAAEIRFDRRPVSVQIEVTWTLDGAAGVRTWPDERAAEAHDWAKGRIAAGGTAEAVRVVRSRMNLND